MLLSGDELRKVVSLMNPFDRAGHILPEAERRTVLAANANMPVEIFGRAMVMAAAQGPGSPLIIQMSYNALEAVGGDSLLSGARTASYLLEQFTENCGAGCVALSLDHFKVPPFAPAATGAGLMRRVQRARLDDAMEAASTVLPEVKETASGLLEQYVDYMCSEPYHRFKREFLSVVSAISPAWGMIDTEHLPPLLDFAVTREVSDAVRYEIGDTGMMLEAEYGATGQSGNALPYRSLTGDELDAFAGQVAMFVKYTSAEGIAYPIGMEHAAKKGELHEPDVGRLLAVQSRITGSCGRYVPFAQHGGTGAAHLERGLVGKNNVNTRFLVVGAGSLAQWVSQHHDGILAGDKNSSGHGMYEGAIRDIAEECVLKLKEAGTYGMAPECIEAIINGEAS